MRAPQAASSRFTSAPYVLVAPLALVLVVFFGIPLVLVVVVSFFDLDKFDIIPTFVLTNYSELLSSPLTYTLYAKTLKYALIVWAITLVIGFTVSYFLVFHVRSILWQMGLFLLCTVPFWTSNVIRMISWIPLLGRHGLLNQSLIALVMGDFFVVKVMSGGQSASVAAAMSNEIAILQYPPAAANAVCLLTIVTLMVAVIMRVVDVRRELSG